MTKTKSDTLRIEMTNVVDRFDPREYVELVIAFLQNAGYRTGIWLLTPVRKIRRKSNVYDGTVTVRGSQQGRGIGIVCKVGGSIAWEMKLVPPHAFDAEAVRTTLLRTTGDGPDIEAEPEEPEEETPVVIDVESVEEKESSNLATATNGHAPRPVFFDPSPPPPADIPDASTLDGIVNRLIGARADAKHHESLRQKVAQLQSRVANLYQQVQEAEQEVEAARKAVESDKKGLQAMQFLSTVGSMIPS